MRKKLNRLYNSRTEKIDWYKYCQLIS